MKKQKNIFKYLIGLLVVLFLRLLPHPPNVEPIMSTMMPFAKRWGKLAGFIFVVIVMLTFDLMTGTLGLWSILTIGTYSLLALFAGKYFTKRSGTKEYVKFSVVGTLIYDGITGILGGMFFFGQDFMVTLIGQIPFTLYHLGGNVVLALVVSPALFDWVLDNPKLDREVVLKRIGIEV